MMMMGKDFNDKVTEYRILNEQLMTKALALLKTADDLMIETESDAEEKNQGKPKKYCEDLESSLSELSKSFENLKTPKESYLSTDTDNLNEKTFENKAFDDFMKTKNKIKNKFYFPKHNVGNEDSLLEFNDELDTSLDEQENGEINGIKNMFQHQKESDTIMKNFMNTKSALLSRNQKETENGDQPSKITDQCVKVLKYKIESLENELKINQENLKKKTSECDKFSKENQSLSEGKTKLNAHINAIKSQLIKRDEKIFNLSTKIQGMENELRTMKSEHEASSKTAKDAVQDFANLENKYTKAMKEIAALKDTLNACKTQEKEQRDSHRKQIDEMTAFMKAAEKKEKAYEAAMKKQMLLVDNLKKQVGYLTMSNNLENTEKQLDSILKLEVSKK